MFSIAALVPSPPILVPELCGGLAATPGIGQPDVPLTLREAALAAAGALAGTRKWLVVGTGTEDQALGADALGTFRGFGADVRVALSEAAMGDLSAEPDPELPLPALVAGWLRGRAAPASEVSVRIVAADTSAERCAEIGAELRGVLDGTPEPVGVLVVADGAATLSLKAPGYLDPRAEAVQAGLDRALSHGDRAGLLALDPALCAELVMSGRAAYQVLAGLFAADAADPAVETLYQDAPFGVGYDVSVWRPADGDTP
ncbi:hypothetical protein [Nocardia sp. NPDC052566]|uniref:hypothetical protein n=1 Tax=Nocardia sp. NPDC052566 TaxID=3364330 RepID=UPI0037CC8CFB